MKVASSRAGISIEAFGASTLATLDWPSNVVVVERGMKLSEQMEGGVVDFLMMVNEMIKDSLLGYWRM